MTNTILNLFCIGLRMVSLESFAVLWSRRMIPVYAAVSLMGGAYAVVNMAQPPPAQFNFSPPATATSTATVAPSATSTAVPTPTPAPALLNLEEFDFGAYEGGAAYQAILEQSDVGGTPLRDEHGGNINGFADTIALHPNGLRTYNRDEWLDLTRRVILVEGEVNVEYLVDEFHSISNAVNSENNRVGNIVTLDVLAPNQYAVNCASFMFVPGWGQADVVANLDAFQVQIETLLESAITSGGIVSQHPGFFDYPQASQRLVPYTSLESRL